MVKHHSLHDQTILLAQLMVATKGQQSHGLHHKCREGLDVLDSAANAAV